MLILKSASPRRKEILQNLGLSFKIEPADIDESDFSKESPLDYLSRVSTLKLEIEKCTKENLYISSDTIVVFENKIIQKPKSFEEAFQTLTLLNNKTHSVYSGLGIFSNGKISFSFDETTVSFKNLTNLEIENYINTSKPYDKAGSYGIQDSKSPVKNFEGSYSNVMGFPIREFFKVHPLWQNYFRKTI